MVESTRLVVKCDYIRFISQILSIVKDGNKQVYVDKPKENSAFSSKGSRLV